ncbi:MAG: peptide deformylase [Planctomycetia bacterium]|nr:peptide deformylase [Planctomycetia bacterium]
MEQQALQVLPYPHPALRRPCKPLRRVDAELLTVIEQMFEAMYVTRGVGLAANQVGLPLRLFVANLEGEAGKGEELVFINPVISRPKGNEEAEEGCLSLPGLYAQVRRPAKVHLSAFNLNGGEVEADVEGLLARVAQHEMDHLDGVLFIDRLSEGAALDIRDGVAELESNYAQRIERGEIPSEEQIAQQQAAFEERYC